MRCPQLFPCCLPRKHRQTCIRSRWSPLQSQVHPPEGMGSPTEHQCRNVTSAILPSGCRKNSNLGLFAHDNISSLTAAVRIVFDSSFLLKVDLEATAGQSLRKHRMNERRIAPAGLPLSCSCSTHNQGCPSPLNTIPSVCTPHVS